MNPCETTIITDTDLRTGAPNGVRVLAVDEAGTVPRRLPAGCTRLPVWFGPFPFDEPRRAPRAGERVDTYVDGDTRYAVAPAVQS